jgi:hypothetical protein
LLSAKYGIPGNQDGRSRVHNLPGIFHGDSAVHFQFLAGAGFIQQFADAVDPRQAFRKEGLAAEPRFDRHDQHLVAERQAGRDGKQRGFGAQAEPAARALNPDAFERSDEVFAAFHVDGDDVGARLGKGRDELLRGLNHQMDVHQRAGFVDQRGHGPDQVRTEGDVRDEFPVHHIQVDILCAAFQRQSHLFSQTKKIGVQDGGSYFYCGRHTFKNRPLSLFPTLPGIYFTPFGENAESVWIAAGLPGMLYSPPWLKTTISP